MKKLVSVIIPVYNAEKYIVRCINSVINQTYKNIEIIIINDGSTDNSLKIIKEYANNDTRIKLIDKINEGVSIARNTGIMAAIGEYICFVDADDYIDKLMIEKLVNVINKKNVDIVRTNNIKVTISGKKIQENLYNYSNKKLNKEQIKNELIYDIISGKIPAFVYLLIIKKEKIKTLFLKGIPFMEDTLFFIELLLNIDSIYFLDEILYHYELNEESATQNPEKIENNIYSTILVYKEIEKILKKFQIINHINYEVLNNSMSERILNFIYLMDKSKKNIQSVIQNKEVLILFSKCNIKELKYHNKLAINAIKQQKLLKLKIIFNLRKIITSIKK